MNTQLFNGELVRLSAPDSDTDPEVTTKWWRDTEFARLLDNDPAMLRSGRKEKEQLEELLKEDPFFFRIRTRSDDRLIGFIGLFDVNWAQGNAWVGLGIGERDCWGKGYGTDAMRIILRYAFTELNLHRVTLGVFEYNSRAIKSYEKAGFVVEGRVRQEMAREGRRWDVLYMGILREEWPPPGVI
jgi:RimJ/RimL family protein N-acetyltransferase